MLPSVTDARIWGSTMVIGQALQTTATPHEPVLIPLARIAEELVLPVEVIRIGAIANLSLDVYDPEKDLVTERGRQQIRECMQPW